ncbi:uncharacterized protein SPPG_00298 [Spizellomyces punctatus DAOM BR117]|uniref:AB hydrolase-1 domain-containing protein n=1 Tax=Spizellomyces punctatus (strain DAOM BR117) TaxID=645134 RepID=A0A0L0HU11_SPIPD|nr:uncharacterized protein SPPG_00298 [Spizellomyces punctatus DAOM BR117]KND04578.1 hypothetical protein SPPG_00298 [Spizellomyces punctatus DAOM BR117]|eukprot:XP_016612617.1 hypothetical protein SPPG_00298 [Spizellomyces punctatus DAOM BR117]
MASSSETHDTTTQFYKTPDGATIAYHVLGAKNVGIPLILVMGLTGVKEDWAHFAYDLSRTRPVCVLDNRGIGESSLSPPLPPFRDPPQLTITQMATDVFSILLHLKWHRFHLLGMSMGGMIAQQLALLLRGRDDCECLSLVLLCTTPKAALRGFLAQLHAKLSDSLAVNVAATGGASKSNLTADEKLKLQRAMIESNFTPDWCRANSAYVDTLIQNSAKWKRPIRITVQQLEALSTFDVTDQLHLVSTPALVVHGLNDQLINAQFGASLTELLPNSRLLTLPNVGHMMYHMDDGQTATAIESFLREVEGGARAHL